jgi:hypothetical protein
MTSTPTTGDHHSFDGKAMTCYLTKAFSLRAPFVGQVLKKDKSQLGGAVVSYSLCHQGQRAK